MSASSPVEPSTGGFPEAWANAWYLAYTKPSQEKIAAEHLARQGYESYLPLYKKWPKTSSKRTTAAPVVPNASLTASSTLTSAIARAPIACFEPMFARYVFFKPASAAQSLSPARSTRGVCTLVSFGQGPAQVDAQLVERIRALEAHRNEAGLQELTSFQPGTAVRLKDEQLQALQGLVIASSAQRVTVLLEILGRPTAVHAQHGQLELV